MSGFRSKLAALIAAVLTLSLLPALSSTAGARRAPRRSGSPTAFPWMTRAPSSTCSSTVTSRSRTSRSAHTVGPLTLPAATYGIEVKLANTDTVAISQDVAVPAGGNFSVVASYVDAAGTSA